MSDTSIRPGAYGPRRRLGATGPALGLVSSFWVLVAPLVALAVVGLGVVLGWRGVDVAASVHRILQFRQDGFALWDNSWYGGQWTLDYSVVFAPVAATLGLHLLALLAAAISALAFERLLTRHFGPAARPAVVVFALSTVVETAIGQLPFLSGEAAGLVALWAATRRRWPTAWLFAAGAALLSPLAGAFVALAALGWLAGSHRWQDRRFVGAVLGLPLAVGLPLLVTTVLFPGEGKMPFRAIDLVWDLAIAAAIFVVTPRAELVLRRGILVYAAALTGSYLVASPLGSNVGRLEDCMAVPLAVLVLWPRRRLVLLVVVGAPLLLSQWLPAWGAMTSLPSQPSSQEAFYAPLDQFLTRVDPDGRTGRVEVVPTVAHWESVWVADVEPLARGWERQSDVTENPIFYRPGALTPAAYLSWLQANGVAYVALPVAPLDYAAAAEGRLVAAGVPGLRPVWDNRHWRVWAVTGSTGLLEAPGTVEAVDDQHVVIKVDRPGSMIVRVEWAGNWAVTSGDACATSGGRWTRLEITRPGTIVLGVALADSRGRCHTS